MNEQQLNDIVERVKLSDMISDNEESLGDEHEENESEMDDEMDISNLIETYFTESKKGRNIADILCEIKRNFEVHNKLLLKLVNVIENKKK